MARYSKKEAIKLKKELEKSPPLSFYKGLKPKYTIKHEKYQGKFTDRWVIWECGKTVKMREERGL